MIDKTHAKTLSLLPIDNGPKNEYIDLDSKFGGENTQKMDDSDPAKERISSLFGARNSVHERAIEIKSCLSNLPEWETEAMKDSPYSSSIVGGK